MYLLFSNVYLCVFVWFPCHKVNWTEHFGSGSFAATTAGRARNIVHLSQHRLKGILYPFQLCLWHASLDRVSMVNVKNVLPVNWYWINVYLHSLSSFFSFTCDRSTRNIAELWGLQRWYSGLVRVTGGWAEGIGITEMRIYRFLVSVKVRSRHRCACAHSAKTAPSGGWPINDEFPTGRSKRRHQPNPHELANSPEAPEALPLSA